MEKNIGIERHTVTSDSHRFLGRIFDLGMVGYEELSEIKHCKYAFDLNQSLNILTSRVETLNFIGNALWADCEAKNIPISLYEWLSIVVDAFFVRYISVIDCSLIFVNDIFELDLSYQDCRLSKMKKKIPSDVNSVLSSMLSRQKELREERNKRFHRGWEKELSKDDMVFRMASMYEGVRGTDRAGREINLMMYYNEAVHDIKKTFNEHSCKLEENLDRLYDALAPYFEERFVGLYGGPPARY